MESFLLQYHWKRFVPLIRQKNVASAMIIEVVCERCILATNAFHDANEAEQQGIRLVMSSSRSISLA